MSSLLLDPKDRAAIYTNTTNQIILEELGHGQDGMVFSTNRQRAIKAFRFPELYLRELEIYHYLRQWEITEVNSFHIPVYVASDDELAVIEMTIVSPPRVLDFVAARIEMPVEYTDEWIAEKEEVFGDDWPQVKRVIWGFEQQGIYLSDVTPNNICCR